MADEASSRAGAPAVAPGTHPKPRPPRLRRSLALILLVGLAGLVAWAGRGYRRHSRRAAANDPTSFLTNFAPLKLVDQSGRPFDWEGLAGKVVLFNFMFTSCPSVCPVQTSALANVQRGLPERDRDRVHFVSVSVDPARDTPQALKAYGEHFRVDFSHWTFVTGGAADVHYLSERLRLFANNDDSRPENHGTTLWLMDGQGRLMQRYAANPPEVPRLVDELDRLANLND